MVKKTALLSVYDKSGLEDFAGSLIALGWDLLASRGTKSYLQEKGIIAQDVTEIVGPPILGHRVVTLSREIHAALLATDSEEDKEELKRLGIPRIDLVYVNFYPLVLEIENPNHTLESVIEKTDIGGPTLLRSAAKGRRMVLYRVEDLRSALEYLRGELILEEGKYFSYLTSIAERAVSDYCFASANFHRKESEGI